MNRTRWLIGIGTVICAAWASAQTPEETAQKNGEAGRRAWLASWRYSQGWLQHADPGSGLIPRNLSRDAYWNAEDAAADNYPFLVLTTWFTDPATFDTRMKDMLEAEQRLTNRVDRLPDDFLFATQNFRTAEPVLDDIIFGASEYVKDGLLPLTEWLGPSPWSDRMEALLDDIWKQAHIETEVGLIPADSHEVAGDLMQGLARMYWMTGKEAYREQAFRLGDYFLVHHSPVDADRLGLDDHGCEVVNGLSEVYYLAAHKDPERRERWRPALHRMLDRILEVGRDENGLLYNAVNPRTGEILSEERTDNWGYNYLAYLVAYQLDGVERYRVALDHVMRNLPASKDYPWEGGRMDGYADALEGCLNLMNRLPGPEPEEFADHVASLLLATQRDTGVCEGWHGDGNFARTALMYALWKSQGAYADPWRADLRVGAARAEDGSTVFVVTSDWPWKGRLRFDVPRHREFLRLPSDYPRLNQFPEWFTAAEGETIESDGGEIAAESLRKGLEIEVRPDQPFRIRLKKKGD